MNQTTNDKKITKGVLNRGFPHLVAVEDDIIDVVRVVFSDIGKAVENDQKVLIKNFGTFSRRERIKRRRFDQGLKQVVETEPKIQIEFVQSPNVFRQNEEENNPIDDDSEV